MTDNSTELWEPNEYALIDFGGGRKLERLGGVLLDRPSPPAVSARRSHRDNWKRADVRLDQHGKPVAGSRLPPEDSWIARFGEVVFNLRLTPFGHVGVFPEQAGNWHWLAEELAKPPVEHGQIHALNLFAYTGGTTLALAAAGAHVVHVDASAPAVAWARRNAVASRMDAKPIRWIVEDARKFVTRELRRGRTYDVIVMDPPTYGHGPSGRRWDIQTHLEDLLRDCLQLLSGGRGLLLVTAHSEMPNVNDVAKIIAAQSSSLLMQSGRLTIRDEAARALDAGYFLRATRAGDAS